MNTCPDRTLLQAFVRGEGSRELANHVEACPACQGWLAALPTEPDTLERELAQAAREIEFTDAECGQALAAVVRATPTDPHATQTTIPIRLAGYDLLHPIGEPSGMGIVYKARQTAVGNRAVAVKLIRPDRCGPNSILRFRREIIAGGMLEHPYIVRVYDAGVSGGWPYLVMEYLDGLSLGALVRARGPQTLAAACEFGRQAAIALDYVHRRNIVHRDVKPGNLFLTHLGQVKLLDLGLARLTDPTDKESLTSLGAALGTPTFMAPEQAANASAADARADLYGLGGVLFFLLTGHRPSSGRLRDLCPHVPETLAALIDRLLDADPARRPDSAAEVVAALQPFAGGRDASLLLGVATGPAATLDAILDVLLWDERGRRHVPMVEPGVLPLRPGARFQIEVRLSRPAFVYLVWINTEGKAQPLYPWQGGRWDAYASAAPDQRLFLPLAGTDGEYRPWTLTGPAGVETVVLLAHTDPLPDSVVRKLPGRLNGVGRPGDVRDLPDSGRGFWFTSRKEKCGKSTQTRTGGQKGIDFGDVPIRDPIFQIHSLLRDRLGDNFGLIHALSFANLGDEGDRR